MWDIYIYIYVYFEMKEIKIENTLIMDVKKNTKNINR